MRILVVGAGSTGGYFGARLAQAGRDVTFLVRPTRAEQLRDRGLSIVSPHGNATLAPTLVTTAELSEPFDVVLLTVKAPALDAALEDVAAAIGPDTMILPVLNGMRQVEAITTRFGTNALVGCACKIATILDDDGTVVQLTSLQDFAYGEMNGARTDRILRLDQVMRGAGFDARLSSDIALEMWEKWILLATVGGITCLMRGPVGTIVQAPGGKDFIAAFLDEVVAVVSKVGRAPSERFLAAARAQLTDPSSQQTSSMYRDLVKGRPVEADQILGDLAARGRLAGVPTPLIGAAYTHLSVYQLSGRPT
jgi:2-dehydropantoate 2-reductase